MAVGNRKYYTYNLVRCWGFSGIGHGIMGGGVLKTGLAVEDID